MTIKQKQCLLAFLGYYKGTIDGKWGQQSLLATEAFQNAYGLGVDGIFGPSTETKIRQVIASGEKPKNNTVSKPQTGTFWDGIKHFTRSEFGCQCGRFCNGFPVEPDKDVVRIADKIRERIGKPIPVNSGIRCKQHNDNVGGVSNSQHLYGIAIDLGCPAGVTPAKMAAIAEEYLPNTGGIGIYSWGIHVDTRKAKSRWNG